jgi:hypothetical protein
MYSLLVTAFNQFGNGPLALPGARFHCWRASDCPVNLAEVLIRELRGHCSF